MVNQYYLSRNATCLLHVMRNYLRCRFPAGQQHNWKSLMPITQVILLMENRWHTIQRRTSSGNGNITVGVASRIYGNFHSLIKAQLNYRNQMEVAMTFGPCG